MRYRFAISLIVASCAVSVPMASSPRAAEIIPLTTIDAYASLEERELPGRQILKNYMDIMRANNQPIDRHWDRE